MKFYEMNCAVSQPVLLNCWKHHAGFIRSKIIEYQNRSAAGLSDLQNRILMIGESLMDLYLGYLTPDEIADSIIGYFHDQNILKREDYHIWLTSGGAEFRNLVLNDASIWTLRLGVREERYVHIHPSRYSPHTIRVRSSTLKSAILYLVLETRNVEDQLTLVNDIRKTYLNLPPLKNLKPDSALSRLITQLT
jgi:hypothetical protein